MNIVQILENNLELPEKTESGRYNYVYYVNYNSKPLCNKCGKNELVKMIKYGADTEEFHCTETYLPVICSKCGEEIKL